MFSQIPSSITILQSGLIGYQAISLTEFTTSAASLIAAGSSVEIAGAYFKAATDITPTATSLTAISSLTTCYLALTPSGTAGSQILTATWEAAAPVWSASKQGWYASAASNVRIVAAMYKVATGNYQGKYLMQNSQSRLSQGLRIYSTYTLATTGSTIVLPEGLYTIYGRNTSGASGLSSICTLQIKDSSGSWRTIAASSNSNTTYTGSEYRFSYFGYSDGLNLRILHTTTGTGTSIIETIQHE